MPTQTSKSICKFPTQNPTRNDCIDFNASSPTNSMIMKVGDYLRAPRPTIFSIAEKETPIQLFQGVLLKRL